MGVERIIDCGGDEVFVGMSERATGALSAVPSEQRVFAVITVKDGKIRRYREFSDERMALEPAGLEE